MFYGGAKNHICISSLMIFFYGGKSGLEAKANPITYYHELDNKDLQYKEVAGK